jgi:alpha-mannosidase
MINEMTAGLYQKKIEQFVSRWQERIVPESFTLAAQYAVTAEPTPFAARLELSYGAIAEGEHWGDAWDCGWFHIVSEVPADWAGKEVVAWLDFNGEGLVYDADGTPRQGLTNGSVFVGDHNWTTRSLFPIGSPARGGEAVDLWIETGANGLFGVARPQDPERDSPTRHGTYEGTVQRLRLGVFDHELWRLLIELDLLAQLMQALPEGSARRARILHGLNQAVDRFADNAANTAAARACLKPLLDQPAHASAPVMIAVGHAHIDTAWLWPVRESVRKTGRTFANQLDLMDRYPDYVFGASQPQLYAFVKQHYPSLYKRVGERVAEGRWEAQGAMWVEADCNITGGESLVRQVVHGKNFYRDEFGIDVRTLWLPDVFGYSASMPQIMRRAGVDYFLTQKLSWGQFNKFPHTTFRWRGIDGTELLTHFPPENTYNARMNPGVLCSAERNFREKAILDEMMSLFGVGDGGGGPTAEMIELGMRQASLEGVPKVRFGRADDFFDRLAERQDDLPVWSGELYLELHRGTLTTQARTKRGNRKLELALRATEYLWTCLPLDSYPLDTLDEIWKTLMINQFHDILPGSSIRRVYEEAEQQYDACLARCAALQADAAGRLLTAAGDTLTLVNTLNTAFTQPVVLPAAWGCRVQTTAGDPAPVQVEADGVAVAAVTVPPQGMVALVRGEALAAPSAAGAGLVLENNLIRYELDACGAVVAAYDKEEGREVLAPGELGNVLTLYDDHPTSWDAWDIDLFYEQQVLDRAHAVAAERIADGPVRQGLLFRLAVGDSEIEQRVFLAANSRRLEFQTTVEWRERHRMLRTAFPVAVSDELASFEIQYGYVQRPTHRNTSWDMARFEVAAQRYADLSDAQYGVAILNDCKYGHKIYGHVLDLNLLRAPTHPDPDADLGRHEFTYALLPHRGRLVESDVMAEAAQLNQPLLVFDGYRCDGARPPVAVSGPGVSLEVLKRAEKEVCPVIRLVETRGQRTTAEVRLADPNASLVPCDLLEWTDEPALGSGSVQVAMRPFDILTFKIVHPKTVS